MYPFNPRQELPSNKIANESHSLSGLNVPFRMVVPKQSPFFKEGLVVKSGSTVLKEGEHYYLTHQFKTGTHITAKPIYGTIYIVDNSVAGALTVSYDTLGGDYLSNVTVSNTPSLEQTDPTSQLWEDVIGDLPFPPVDIKFEIERDGWQSEAEFIASLESLADGIEGRDPTEQDLHNFLLDRIIRLEAIFNDAQAAAHVANKNNPHGTTAWDAGALHKDASAADTAKAFTRSLTELAAYINNQIVPAGDLDDYLKLANANVMSGSIQYRNGQFSLLSNDGRAGVYFNDNNVNLVATNNITLQAGSDGSGDFTFEVGANTLTVGSSLEAARVNDKDIATVANSAALGESNIDTTRLHVETRDTDTLTWSGLGTAASPLVATIVTTDASTSAYGVFKIGTKTITSNSTTLAATPWHVTEIRSIINDLANNNVTINGKLLTVNPSVNKNDPQIDKGNVRNYSDANMPTSKDNRSRLEQKAVEGHGHDLEDITGVPTASTTTKGLGLIASDVEDGVTNVALHRNAVDTLSNNLIQAKARSSDLFPVGVLNINAYGDNTYLPAPVTGSFNNVSSFWLSTPTLVEGNYLTMLRLGRDNDSSGLMLSYGELDGNGNLTSMTNTVKEYNPTWMPTNVDVTGVFGGAQTHFLMSVKDRITDNVRWFLVKTNGTMNQLKHQAIEVTSPVTDLDQHSVMCASTDRVVIFEWFNRRIWKIDFSDNWFSDQSANAAELMQVNDQLRGNNLMGQPLNAAFFYATTISTSLSNSPLIYSTDGHRDSARQHGRGVVGYLEGDEFYIKIANDFLTGRRAGGESYFNHCVMMSFKINIRTFDVEFVGQQQAPVHVSQSSLGTNHRSWYRGGKMSQSISSTAGISSNRNTGLVINNREYNFIQHASDKYVAQDYDNAGDSSVDHFTLETYDPPSSNRRSYSQEGASYDGYKKPFEGAMIGPEVGGKPTLFFRGDGDSQIFWAQAAWDNAVGYKPYGFRQQISGTSYQRAGYCQFIRLNSSGIVNGDGYILHSTYKKCWKEPTAVEGSITYGAEITMSDAHINSIREALKADMIRDTHLTSCSALEFSIHYRPDIGARFIVCTAVGGGKGADAVYTFTNSDIYISGSTMVHGASNFTLVTISNRSTAYHYAHINHTELVKQSFITDWGSNKYTFCLSSAYAAVSQTDGHYLKLEVTINNNGTFPSFTYAGFYGSSYWSIIGLVPGKFHRPMWASTDANSVGVVLSDRNPTWEDFNSPDYSYDRSSPLRFSSILHDESWNLAFYAARRLILNGVEYTMPVQNIDVSQYPPHQNSKFYIFAELDGTNPVYEIYRTESSPREGILIGYLKTSDTQITEIVIDSNVSVGLFRELERHISDYDDPHGVVGGSAESLGLGELINQSMKHDLTQINFSDVFNDWDRFSHSANGHVYPADSSELTTWAYRTDTDEVYTTVNSVTYQGFVSNLTYGDYQFDTKLKLRDGETDSDDDTIAVVIAYKESGGIQHTLSVVRICNVNQAHVHGPTSSRDTFAIFYNYGQSSEQQITTTSVFNAGDVGKWINRECTVRVTREGNRWVVTSTPISPISSPSTETAALTVDISDYSELSVFTGAVKIGYACESQLGSSFVNLRRPDGDVTANYGSRAMVADAMEGIEAPLCYFGVTSNGNVPVPQGYLRENMTVVPIVERLGGSGHWNGQQVSYDPVTGNITLLQEGTTGNHTPSSISYFVYATK